MTTMGIKLANTNPVYTLSLGFARRGTNATLCAVRGSKQRGRVEEETDFAHLQVCQIYRLFSVGNTSTAIIYATIKRK